MPPTAHSPVRRVVHSCYVTRTSYFSARFFD
jgi:hypothetical protein